VHDPEPRVVVGLGDSSEPIEVISGCGEIAVVESQQDRHEPGHGMRPDVARQASQRAT
jgi:hypothetical protein